MDWMAVSSYGSGTKSSGVVRILKDLDRDITGQHVLVVEDIIDSGLTLSWLLRTCVRGGRSPSRCSRCCASPTRPRFRCTRYVGFDIPNEFVVGYGLDYAERYRNLPFVATLAPTSTRLTVPPGRPPGPLSFSRWRKRVSPSQRSPARRCTGEVSPESRAVLVHGGGGGARGPRTHVRRYFRGPVFWITLAVLGVLVVAQLLTAGGGFKQVHTSEVIADINAGKSSPPPTSARPASS